MSGRWRQTLPGVRLVNAKEADRREKAAQQPHWGDVLKKRDERVQRERLAAKRRRRAIERLRKARLRIS